MIGIVAVVAGLILAAVSRARRAATGVACVAHLRQFQLAFNQYATDNDGRFPNPYAAGASWEHLLRQHLSDPNVYRCGADPELFPALGSSYDWRDTGRAETTLTGRLRTDCNRADAVLVFDALPGWHAPGMMNAALFDGSARPMPTNECLSDLQRPIRPR